MIEVDKLSHRLTKQLNEALKNFLLSNLEEDNNTQDVINIILSSYMTSLIRSIKIIGKATDSEEAAEYLSNQIVDSMRFIGNKITKINPKEGSN